MSKLATKLLTHKWLLNPAYHSALVKAVQHYMNGSLAFDLSDAQATTDDNSAGDGPVAVISVSGVLSKGVSQLEELLCNMTDVDAISDALDEAASDPSISHIVLSFASPGGETTGIEELARKISDIDTNIKPVLGWTEIQACSAAYWLISQCRTIGMTPSSQVGSVGVYTVVTDQTKALEQAGITIEAFYSGDMKLMGHEWHTLTKDEREWINTDVKKQHQKFKDVISSKRPQINVSDFEGLAFEGAMALDKGFVDSLHDSLNEFLANNVV